MTRDEEKAITNVCAMVCITRDDVRQGYIKELARMIHVEAREPDAQIASLTAELMEAKALLKQAKQPLRRATVEVIALNSGFSYKPLEDGKLGLKDYVFAFAEKIRAL